jgi:hypothetical protein
MFRSYPLGKTPLAVRVERYIEWHRWTHGSIPGSVPIHPKELSKLWDSQKFNGTIKVGGECYMLRAIGQPG